MNYEDSIPEAAGARVRLPRMNTHACRETCWSVQRVLTAHTALKIQVRICSVGKRLVLEEAKAESIHLLLKKRHYTGSRAGKELLTPSKLRVVVLTPLRESVCLSVSRAGITHLCAKALD